MSKKTFVIIDSRDGRFFKGNWAALAWTLEYPDARLYFAPGSAVAAARKLRAEAGIATKVIENYGLETQREVSIEAPPPPPVHTMTIDEATLDHRALVLRIFSEGGLTLLLERGTEFSVSLDRKAARQLRDAIDAALATNPLHEER